jgi:hypothetical protein
MPLRKCDNDKWSGCMECRQQYKGFIIEARPYEFRDVSGWGTESYIEEHDEAGVNITQSFLPNQISQARSRN